MTDSMKFGPGWLRNLSTDGQAISVNLNNSNLSSNNSICGINSKSGFNTPPVQNTSRNMFPEFRYGREEMLSLFDKNCETPDILPMFKRIFIEKVQFPLALTPTTDDEIVMSGQAVSARPMWMQRSPVGFSSSRGIGRGGITDRGRMRGKMIYHPSTFQRSSGMFDEDGSRLLPTKLERNWSDRNGNNDSFNNAIPVNTSDWANTPNISPRKEHSNHVRNMENWRRGRSDDAANEVEGWRTPSSNTTGAFSSNHRWARSTSWRDEESGNSNDLVQGVNTIQRSFSSVSTTDRTGGYSSNATAKSIPTAKHQNKPLNYASDHQNPQAGRSTHWNGGGGTREGVECEDNLPEWATENPSESGGTFDASGAFHGCLEEEDIEVHSSEHLDTLSPQKDSSQKVVLNNNETESDLKKSIDKPAKSFNDAISLDKTKANSIKLKESSLQNKNAEIIDAILIEATKHPENAYNLKDPNELVCEKSDLSRHRVEKELKLDFTETFSTARNELAVNLDKVADDMVEKLIKEDDIGVHIRNVHVNRENFEGDEHAASSVTGPDNIKQSYISEDLVKAQQMLQVPEHHDVSENSISTTQTVSPDFPGSPKSSLPLYIIMNQPPVAQHHLSLQSQNFAPVSALHHEVNAITPSAFWYYRDPQSKVQGPFTALEMTEWYRAGYFNENLFVRRSCDSHFRALGELIKICNGNMPFTHSHLLDVLDVASPKDQREELKGSVTAAADALSSAVKNLSSVDMLQILNTRFRMLQEQHIRRQKMHIYAELSKNEHFLQLNMTEKEAIVRQRLQMLVLPEYLTSLTGLGNSLATLNPTAGTQLFDIISECSKKNIDPVYTQSQPLNNFCSKLDIEQFLSNTQKEMQQTQPHGQAQYSSCFQPNTPHSNSNNSANNDLLGDINLQLYMSKAQQHQQQQARVNSSTKELPQDMAPNDFIPSQSYISTAGLPSSVVPTTSNSMLPMWNAPQSTSIPDAQPRQHNHWKTDDQLLGISNRIVPVEKTSQLGDCVLPNALWELKVRDTAISGDFALGETSRMENPEVKIDISENNESVDLVNLIASANENLSKIITKQTQQQDILKLGKQSNSENSQKMLNKKGKTQQVVVKPKEDNKQKTDVEDKRRLKEERKRQSIEEEKRRAQQVEEDKRRQILEEKERQQQIQMQRRKAMLAASNENQHTPQSMFKNLEERRVQTSAVAPWSNQTLTSSSNSGPCFAEIQKAERRERRADQQRQMELMGKQIRASAAEPTESVLKWNSSSVPVKSIVEIQAEEAKQRSVTEAQQDFQRKKDQQLEQTSTNPGASSFSLSGSQLASAWGNNKTWGNNANSSSTGFWEETVKYSSLLASSSSSSNQNTKGAIAKNQPLGKSQNTLINETQSSNVEKSSRNLKKSQTVSVMQRTGSEVNALNTKNAKQATPSQPKSNGLLKQQGQQEKTVPEKKSQSSTKANVGSNISSAKDEHEQEFINWCTRSLNNMNTKIDVPTFVTFLQALESPFEVKDYIRMYLGESKEFNDFAKQFLDRRSKYKNLQRAQNAHNDDMCKPAPAITPYGNDNVDNKNKKKAKKSKMTKLDARILGFSVTSAEGRLNVGDRDYAEAS